MKPLRPVKSEFVLARVATSLLAFCVTLAALADNQTGDLALIVDHSASMDGAKLAAAKEGGKLAIALFDGTVHVIGFGSIASRSPALPLSTPDSRRTAMQFVDSLTIDGGTNYLAALRAYNDLPPGSVAIFISDGANNEGTDDDVMHLVQQCPGPIFTVAVETARPAKTLLTEMAAASGGAAVSIDNAEDLTTTILKIAQGLSQYRAHLPKEETLHFPGTHGTVIALGYDSVPTMTGRPHFSQPPYQHRAKLPREHVVLSRVMLGDSTDLDIETLHKRTPEGRLASVLRNDLPQARFDLNADKGKVPAGGKIVASIGFIDNQGQPIDPRNRDDLAAGIRVRDEDGNLISQAVGKPSPDAPVLIASVDAPDQEGPITVEQISRVTSAGNPFDKIEPQTVIVDKQTTVTLVATPATMVKEVETGRFELAFTVKPSQPLSSDISYSVDLHTSTDAIRLVQADTTGHKVVVTCEATAPGSHQGFVRVTANSSTPVQPLEIPYQLTVTRTYEGLALPENPPARSLGQFLANAGQVTLPPLVIPALDEVPVPCTVEITDLSNGSSLIPMSSEDSVSPTKHKPSNLNVSANIGDIAPGVYTGSVTFRLNAGKSGRHWKLPIQIVVLDPLFVRPVDFGRLEPGGASESPLVIRNQGPELRGIRITLSDIDARGGLIEMTAPEGVAVLAAKSESTIKLKVFVSETVQSRGEHEGSLVLLLASGRKTVVPIKLEIVDKGEAPSRLVVSPQRIQLAGSTGELFQFDLSVKAPPGVARDDTVEIAASPLATATGKTTSSVPEFKWLSGERVSPDKPVRVTAFLLAPLASGNYRTEISVRTATLGSVTIPLSLEVH